MKKIAVLGFGTIGTGVCKLLNDNADLLKKSTGDDVVLGYICDLRDFPDSPYGNKHIKDFNIVLGDTDVSVVVEVTGAKRAAYELSKKALLAGKSVVTSNKEVVAEYGPELLETAAENGVSYLFEAAVGGAIPLIRPLTASLCTDRIIQICGILNGTTNYILTQMKENGTSYEDALKEAQRLGYAEPDPTADVEGIDTCRKISVLSAFINGELIPPADIPTAGISGISSEVLRLADKLGGKIKLIGCAEKTKSGTSARVFPCFVSNTNALYSVDNVFNAVLVRCESSGDIIFRGRGAGSIPTAAAVLSDVSEAACGRVEKLSWKTGKNALECESFKSFAVVKSNSDIIKTYSAEYSDGGYTAYITDEPVDIEAGADDVLAVYDILE